MEYNNYEGFLSTHSPPLTSAPAVYVWHVNLSSPHRVLSSCSHSWVSSRTRLSKVWVSVTQFFSNLTLDHPYDPLSKTQFTNIEEFRDNI